MYVHLFAAFGLLLARVPEGRPESYRFFLDGEPFAAPAGQFESGGVVEVGGIELTVSEPGEYRFRTAREGVLLELPQGGTRWVAVRVEPTYDNGPGFVDGLAALSEDEVRGLWGLRAETWTPSCAAKARWLDAGRVALVLGQSASEGHDDLPELPVGLRRLRAMRFVGWRSLARLRQLEHLDVLAERGFDLRVITGFARLRGLTVYAESLKGIGALGTLHALEKLDLSHQRDVLSAGFARRMPALRHLGLSGTSVADLSPLSDLARLESIEATFAPLTRLPDGPLPALRTLGVMLTPLTDEAVAAFRRAHPNVRVRHRWNGSLREALVGTTKVRLRPAPGCSLTEAGPVRDVEDPSEIAQLMSILVFDERQEASICGCLGGTSIELHRGDQGFESMQLVCGVSIRWSGWPGDGQLGAERQTALVEWLARQGVTEPREKLREERVAAEAYARKQDRATARMSPSLREAFAREVEQATRWPADESWPAFRKALSAEVPRVEDRIAVLFRVMGAEMGSWSGVDAVDRIPTDLLRTYRPAQLERACAAALRSDDRQLRRGAARSWDAYDSPVPRTLANDPILRSAILTLHQESRSPDVRQRAQRLLLEWWDRLSGDERDSRLLAALHDPSPGVRRQAIIVAGQVGATAAERLLQGVQAGKPIDVQRLPSVPLEEEDVGRTSEDAVGGESSDADLAARALGHIRSRGGCS